MPVGVNESWHHQATPRLNAPGSRRALGETGTNSDDHTVLEEHIGARQVTQVGVHGGHMATADEYGHAVSLPGPPALAPGAPRAAPTYACGAGIQCS
jgi:hypothetical protein